MVMVSSRFALARSTSTTGSRRRGLVPLYAATAARPAIWTSPAGSSCLAFSLAGGAIQIAWRPAMRMATVVSISRQRFSFSTFFSSAAFRLRLPFPAAACRNQRGISSWAAPRARAAVKRVAGRRAGVSAGFRLPGLEKQPLSEVGPAPGRAELQKKRQVVDLKRVRRLHFFGADFNLRI